MSVEVRIRQQACRGCKLCIALCPTDVLAFDEATAKCQVVHAENCIACLSCAYVCPSGAFTHENYPRVRNFYRDLEAADRCERYL